LITEKTVLVLGAGASAPYGFPLGMELVDQICIEILGLAIRFPQRRSLRIDLGLVQRLVEQCGPANNIDDFARALRGLKPYSIDTFLETRDEFLNVGRLAIADVLLRAEADALTLDVDPDKDWYRYLFNTIFLRKNVEHFEQQVSQMSVVTFNFDRSLERALFDCIRYGFGLNEDNAKALAVKLRIYHVHGRLGKPNWLYESPTATSYGATADEDLKVATKKAVEGMRLVHEPGRESDVEKARSAIKDAKTVYFIGFGFDERNLAKIGIPGEIKAAMHGTALHLSAQERGRIQRAFFPLTVTLHRRDDALGFLKEHASALYM
jgi:hypothetical protein